MKIARAIAAGQKTKTNTAQIAQRTNTVVGIFFFGAFFLSRSARLSALNFFPSVLNTAIFSACSAYSSSRSAISALCLACMRVRSALSRELRAIISSGSVFSRSSCLLSVIFSLQLAKAKFPRGFSFSVHLCATSCFPFIPSLSCLRRSPTSLFRRSRVVA